SRANPSIRAEDAFLRDRTRRFFMHCRSILLGIATLFLPLLASTRAGTIVAPGALATTDGNTNNQYPFLIDGGMRYQQVYAASEFRSPGAPVLISALAFRLDVTTAMPFSTTLSDVTIQLSTTGKAVDGLDTTFANNLGADASTVHTGSLMISSSNGAGPNGT